MSEVFSREFLDRLRRSRGKGKDDPIVTCSLPGPPTLDERESSAPVILADARGSEPTETGELNIESADSVPATASSLSDTASPAPKSNVDSQPSWWWARFVGVRDTNRVSLQDAQRCVKLVVAELRGVVAPSCRWP